LRSVAPSGSLARTAEAVRAVIVVPAVSRPVTNGPLHRCGPPSACDPR
jgi:hypothetical protein